MKTKRMALMLLTILIVIFSATASAASTSLTIPDAKGSPEDRAKVPVNVTGLSNVGALSIAVTYDAAVITINKVEAGELAKDSLFDSNTSTPGILAIGVINADGIDGSGCIATMVFDIVGDVGDTSAITLERVVINDADTYMDISVDVTSGTFMVTKQGGSSAIIIGSIIGAVVVVAVALVLFLRRQNTQAKA